jgi:YfiH family protein
MSPTASWFKQSPAFSTERWKHGWSTSEGPDFRGEPDAPDHQDPVGRLVEAAGLEKAAWARQVHGGTVLQAQKEGFCGEADALWTDRSGLGVIGRGADCPLILLGGLRPDGSPVWGFAHASWRSTVAGITTGLVLALKEAGADPASLQAVICPSAGPCCYEVGEEVSEKARENLGPGAAWFFTQRGDGQTFDLWAANIDQLTGAGLSEKNIHNTAHCTICDTGLYPSYRREGQAAGRFAAVIGA